MFYHTTSLDLTYTPPKPCTKAERSFPSSYFCIVQCCDVSQATSFPWIASRVGTTCPSYYKSKPVSTGEKQPKSASPCFSAYLCYLLPCPHPPWLWVLLPTSPPCQSAPAHTTKAAAPSPQPGICSSLCHRRAQSKGRCSQQVENHPFPVLPSLQLGVLTAV